MAETINIQQRLQAKAATRNNEAYLEFSKQTWETVSTYFERQSLINEITK